MLLPLNRICLPTLFCTFTARPFGSGSGHWVTEEDVVRAKLKVIQAEYELLRHQQPDAVPAKLSIPQLDYLLSLNRTKRRGRLHWLDTAYQLREETLQKIAHQETFTVGDSLFFSLFMPLVGSENERLLRRRQLSLAPFLPNIIFDVSFDDHMSSLECKNLAEQLIRIFNFNKFGLSCNNRTNFNLFNLHVTNLQSSSHTRTFLDALFGTKTRPYYPTVHFHDRPFTELFDKKHLIYMSPHASQVMTEYDHNAFYIIGGIVDRREIIELTPDKCNQLGIRSVRLPIEQLVWKEVQSLCDVFKLLYEFKYNNAVKFEQESMSTLVEKHMQSKKLR